MWVVGYLALGFLVAAGLTLDPAMRQWVEGNRRRSRWAVLALLFVVVLFCWPPIMFVRLWSHLEVG